jgi:phosphatidylserine/phosphatidylglycerophosphate/cardiolipin synthase-like enzyme
VSTSVTGRLVDGTDTGIANLHIGVRDDSSSFDTPLGSADSDGNGYFTIAIPDDTQEVDTGTARSLGVYITTQAGREVNTSHHHDSSGATLDLGSIHIRTADASGWTVTLLGSPAAIDVRAGNAVTPLVDDEEAWGYLQKQIAGATQSVNVMQLQMDVPKKFDANPANESPEIVLSFGSPIDPVNPRHLDAGDYRLEHMLLDAAKNNVTVRMLISTNVIPIPLVVAGIILAPLLLLMVAILLAFNVGPTRTLAGLFWGHFFGSGPAGGESDVAKYFKAAASVAKVAPFKTGLFFVVHAKAVITDDSTATLLGSPFSQSYWDTKDHAIFEPRRGSAAGEPIPVHDVSMALRGPVVHDVHEAFRMHWNRDAKQADQITAIAVPGPVQAPNTDESLASVQLVRTINRKIFTGMDEGEKGVLEAYLRAIENAKSYIYLENQYFTNDAIGKALAWALNHDQSLQVILVVNIIPDMPFYPKWQASLIDRIRSGAGANAARLGVFTTWTHNPPMPSRNRNKPMIMPNYLHTKTAIVDGTWATVGSANLDGASLDYFQVLHGLQAGDNRNHELNYVIYNGVEGYAQTDAIDKLRLRLWSEHLAIDPGDARLASTNSASFLPLWKQVADAKRAALEVDPTQINPSLGRVLAFPSGFKAGYGRAPYVDFLTKSKVDLTKVDLLDRTTPFVFKTGSWKS